MPPAQATALRALIAADRQYRARRAEGRPSSPDDRGVEVCATLGVHPLTAQALVAAGLAEMLHTGRNRNNWLFLGRYEPLDR